MLFILEDNDDRINGFKEVLHDAPYHIERTVPEAITWLTDNVDKISLFSLDNDLYVPEFDGDPGEGWQLCEWIITNMDKVPLITHTTNSHAAVKMEMMCEDAGWSFQRIVPYNGFDWIWETWIGIVESHIPSS